MSPIFTTFEHYLNIYERFRKQALQESGTFLQSFPIHTYFSFDRLPTTKGR